MRPIYTAGAIFMTASLLTAGIAAGAASRWPAAARFSDPAACGTSVVYVGDDSKNYVAVYPQGGNNPSPCRTITMGVDDPTALYVDAKGTLYVANYLPTSAPTVTEYLHGGSVPSTTIDTGVWGRDLFVGVDRTLYVAEVTGTVAEYAQGKTLTKTLTVNGEAFGVATDSKNDLYVSYLSNADGVSHVEKFAPKASTGTDLGFTIPLAGSLRLDKNNDIVIGDRNDDIVYVYPPGHTSPSRSFSTPLGKPEQLDFNKAESLLYVSGQGQVSIFDYQTGKQIGSIANGLIAPNGFAAYPPAAY